MQKAVIVGAARTPIGSFMGALASEPAVTLGAIAIGGALERAHLKPNDIDEVIMGQVLQGGAGQAPARQAALAAHIPASKPCTTVNKVCGSGLKAIMMAAQSIALGEVKLAVAGGMESMSNAPYILAKARAGLRMGDQKIVDLMLHDGLLDPYGHAHMGNFGDMCAEKKEISREEQDKYAHESYQKAQEAQEAGYFRNEIEPVIIKQKNGQTSISVDEEPAKYLPEKIAGLRPAFHAHGTVTAANASKINDGAAALIMASEEEAQKRGLSVWAKIIASATYAAEPEWFTTAPAEAIKLVLKKADLSVDDIDCYEINEAFSVVPLYVMRELKIKREKVNIFGGAIALGHPIGCSGARTVVTLLNILQLKKLKLGLVAICLGGGEAVAMIIERAGN